MVDADLLAQLIEALDDAATHCPAKGSPSPTKEAMVTVREFDARQASYCPASVAAPEAPFSVSPSNCFKAIAIAAVPWLRDGATARAAVSEAMQAARNGEAWYSDYLSAAPVSVRVQIAGRAITWLQRSVEVLDGGEISGWRAAPSMTWRHPDVLLTLQGKFDLTTSAGLVAVTPSPSAATDDRLAYLALLACLCGLADRRIIAATHSSGRVDEYVATDLADRGITVAARAAAAVSRRSIGPEGLPRTPALFTCQSCHWHDDCAEREAHIKLPVVRGGIRLTPSTPSDP